MTKDYAVIVQKPGFVDRLLASHADSASDLDIAFQCVQATDAGKAKRFKTFDEAESVAAEFRSRYRNATFVVVRAVYGVVGWKKLP